MAPCDSDKREHAMHVLLLGYSRIARKRVIPALRSFGQTLHLDIASQRSAGAARADESLPGEVFDSYDAALRESLAGLVYVSLTNSDHAPWAERALESGRHVIIDKPAFLSSADARRLLALAKEKKLLLAEATVFPFHPQIECAMGEFAAVKSSPAKITAVFSFPGFQPDDFRYQAKCGGGALNDLGPYAISSGTVFFREHPLKLFCQVTDRTSQGVDRAFSMAALYSGGRAMVGHFGFTTEYQNTLSLLGPSLSISFDRVFTIPADYTNTLTLRSSDKTRQLPVPQADCFANFFKQIFEALKNNCFEPWHEQVLAHATSLELLKSAAEKEGRV